MNWRIIFPLIAGVLLGLFTFDLVFGIKVLNLRTTIITLIIFIITTLTIWYFYSKITKNDLKKDALTFVPFLLLIFFPIRYLIKIPDNLQKATSLPSYLLLLISLSLFIGSKILFFERKLKLEINYKKILFTVVTLYIIIFSTLTVLKHMSFNSTAYDLAIYDQAVWSYSRGKIMLNSVAQTQLLGDHVEPILFLITPLYWVYPSPLILVVIQTIIIAIGAIPLYFLTKNVLKNELIALIIPFAYLIHPSTQYMNLFDFHPETLAVSFILFSLYFLEIRKYSLSFMFLALAGLCKEYVPLLFVTFGVYILFVHKKKILSIISIITGIVWTYANFGIIIPHFSKIGYPYLLGKTPIEIIIEKLLNPITILTQNMPFFILLIIPIGLGLFVLFSPIILLSIFQVGMIIFFSPIGITEIIYHHQATIFPFVIVSSIYGIRNLNNLIKNKKTKILQKKNFINIVAIFILSTSILSFIFYSPFTILYDYSSFNPNTEYVRNGNKIISEIGPTASIVSTNWIVPHLSQREYVFMDTHYTRNKTFSGLPIVLIEAGPPDYILLDLSEAVIDPKRNGNRIKEADINKLFNNLDYGISTVKGTWILLKHGVDYKENICKIKPFLNKKEYPYLNISIEEKELIEKC